MLALGVFFLYDSPSAIYEQISSLSDYRSNGILYNIVLPLFGEAVSFKVSKSGIKRLLPQFVYRKVNPIFLSNPFSKMRINVDN
jgi:hypothetical protein